MNQNREISLLPPQRVLHMKDGSTQAELNHKDYPMTVKPEVKDGEAYIPLKPLKEVYGITVQEDSVTGAVLLMRGGDMIQYAEIDTLSSKADKTVPLYKRGENPHQSLPTWKRMHGYVFGRRVINRVLFNSIMDTPDM